jgi:putative phosphoribosyl transferase
MQAKDRVYYGSRLAVALERYNGSDEVIVCGIPRGGAVVAARVAIDLGVSYECLVVCRIGMPCFPEITLGAIDPEGSVTFDPTGELTKFEVTKIGGSMMDRLAEQVSACRGGRPEPEYAGKTAIVVDDRVADTIVARSAGDYLRSKGVGRLVLATPVISRDALPGLRDLYDEVVAPLEVETVRSLQEFYAGDDSLTDEAVSAHLKAAWDAHPAP